MSVDSLKLSKKLDSVETAELIEWRPPIPFDDMALPDFPVHCLPTVIREYVKAVSEATQTPSDMSAVACLAAMALCVQGKYKIKGKEDWCEPLNLYTVVCMPPAERKSAVIDLITKYIEEYEINENEELKTEIGRNKAEKKLLSNEIESLLVKSTDDVELRKELFEKQDRLSLYKDMKPLRLMTDDVSPEALASLLAENDGKIGLVSAEGGIFETILGRYSKIPNLDVFLKAHCGDSLRVDRKGRSTEFVSSPTLTTLLMVQPQVIEGLMSQKVLRGRGLLARFLYCCPKSKVGVRRFETEPIPESCKNAYKNLCNQLLMLPKEENEKYIVLSDDAYLLSAKFAEELEPRLIDDLELVSDFAGKLHGAILRIAGIIHLVNMKDKAQTTPVPSITMNYAIEIGGYFLEHAKSVFQMMGTDKQLNDAKYVLKKLEKQSELQLKKYDVFRACRGRFKKTAAVLPALELLIELGYIREIPPEQITNSGRKPDNQYLLNPMHFS